MSSMCLLISRHTLFSHFIVLSLVRTVNTAYSHMICSMLISTCFRPNIYDIPINIAKWGLSVVLVPIALIEVSQLYQYCQLGSIHYTNIVNYDPSVIPISRIGSIIYTNIGIYGPSIITILRVVSLMYTNIVR